MKTQEDYIRGLVETRKACDQYAGALTTYPDSDDDDDEDAILSIQIDAPEPRSYFK